MSEFAKSLEVTTSGLRAQATRLRHLSENISNADTPGYRRKTVAFETSFSDGGNTSTVKTSRVRLDPSSLARLHDPSHPMAGNDGYYESSNVDLMIELSDAREAQRSYEANLKVFEQTRKMSSSLMELLRK